MSHPIPQRMYLIAYLKQGYGITPIEALHLFQCNRLAARIRDLRRDGWDIKTEIVTTSSGKRVARYTLTDPAQTEPTGIPQAGRKAKPTTNAVIAQVERELEHARGGKEWKEGARWALEQVKRLQ